VYLELKYPNILLLEISLQPTESATITGEGFPLFLEVITSTLVIKPFLHKWLWNNNQMSEATVQPINGRDVT
jgi:hypothetical protein